MDADDGTFFGGGNVGLTKKSQGQEASDQQTCGKVHCYGSSSSRIAELRGETMTAGSPTNTTPKGQKEKHLYTSQQFLGGSKC